MVDSGVSMGQQPAPPSLLDASRDEARWQIMPFSRIRNENNETLYIVVPRGQGLQSGPEVSGYAESNPSRVSMFWLNQNGRASSLSEGERTIALRALANGTSFQAEAGIERRGAGVESFAEMLDGALGVGPFNPIEGLDTTKALYSIYTYGDGGTTGFFSIVAKEADPEARENMEAILAERMVTLLGEGFDYRQAAQNEATLNEFLDIFSSYLGQGLYHEACMSAFEKIRFTDNGELREMYINALEELAGIPSAVSREWASEPNFLASISDIRKFGGMLVSAVGTESFIGKYPPEFWNAEERRSIELFMEGLDRLIAGFSLPAEEREGIRAEMYANWFVTTNPTLRSALGVEYFRMTGQDIGSEEMAGIYRRRFPEYGLQARR